MPGHHIYGKFEVFRFKRMLDLNIMPQSIFGIVPPAERSRLVMKLKENICCYTQP